MLAHSKNREEEGMMEEKKVNIRNKGGRPRKAIKKDQWLGVRCTLVDRRVIEAKAKLVNLSVSEYLLKIGLTGKIDRREKILPKEILEYKGTLNHLAANINQIARKRNGIDELNAIERASLQVLSGELKRLAIEIKNYLQ